MRRATRVAVASRGEAFRWLRTSSAADVVPSHAGDLRPGGLSARGAPGQVGGTGEGLGPAKSASHVMAIAVAADLSYLALDLVRR